MPLQPHSASTTLAGRRVLITRTRAQASELGARLEARGAETHTIPTIEIAPPLSWASLDQAIAQLRRFDWVLFTSANAVQSFTHRAAALGILPHPRRIAAIGPATAREIQAHGLAVDLLPEKFVAESLAAALLPHAPRSAMLLVRAAQARNILPDALTAAGATLTVAEAYRNVLPPASADTLRATLEDPGRRPHAITFTSSSTATNFFSLLESTGLALDPSISLASIGPVTSATLRDLGHPPHIEAAAATIDGLVEALSIHLASAAPHPADR